LEAVAIAAVTVVVVMAGVMVVVVMAGVMVVGAAAAAVVAGVTAVFQTAVTHWSCWDPPSVVWRCY
jgi:hypothetical protein